MGFKKEISSKVVQKKVQKYLKNIKKKDLPP